MVESNPKEECNEDERNAPAWLNKEFFEQVLREFEVKKDLTVEDFHLSPGTGKGDHYASVMFRAKVNYRMHCAIGEQKEDAKKNISLIIKTVPEEEGLKKELTEEFTLFQTEITMYSLLVPQMEAMLRSVGDKTELCAKMIYSSMSPRQCIIFEDLVVKGYKVATNRSCTMEEVKLALSKLARIHATSLKMLHEGDTEIPKLASLFNRKSFEKFDFMNAGVELFKKIINMDDELRKFIPFVEKVEDTILEDVISYFHPEDIRKRGGIVMLNHGDFHMKNLMMNYSENVLNDLMLVDYQMSYYGPAVLDLLYASVLMFTPEMRLHHREELFDYYIEDFQNVLRKLDFTGHIPTKTEFEEELKMYKRWELFLIMVFLILYYVFVDGTVEFGEISEQYEIRLKFWQDERIFKELRVLLPQLVKQGYFD